MPIDKRELRERKWPLPSFPNGREIREGKTYPLVPYPKDYLESCYVPKENVFMVSLPITPGECAVASLVQDAGGKVYGVTAGEKSHLFVYNPADKSIIDLGIVAEDCEKASLVISPDNKIFIGTKPELNEGHIYLYNLKSVSAKIEKIVSPVKGEGISALVIGNNSNRLYGLSSKTGVFFIFSPDKGSVEVKGQVDKDNLFSEVLVSTSNGDVFGGARWTQLFKYEKEKERLIILDVKAPVVNGREMYNRIDSLVWDEKSQSIYGGTTADGILFHFLPGGERMISLGKPLNQSRIRCLAFGKDEYLYGIAGTSCCYLFRYNPKEGELKDLGILFVSSPRHWHGYEFDAAFTGENGEIYLGESDRISHLFIYSPT